MASLSLLTICGLPEIEAHGQRGVTHVLSILDPEWPDPEAFLAYPRHHRTVLRFHDILDDTPGMVRPQAEHVAAILDFGRTHLGPDGVDPHLLVHCHAGVSRSTAAMTMLLAQAEPDRDEDGILRQIAEVRPQAWPNLRMLELADDQLGRDGRLVAAAGRYYAGRLKLRPELRAMLDAGGREREFALAATSGATA